MINPYFNSGSTNEQGLLEDLIIEAIQAKGQNFFYIPRVLVAKNEILGEDRLSKYQQAYPIEAYLETPEGFGGQGAFIEKFGHLMDQSASVTMSRRRYDQLVGRFPGAQLPNRPAEGDLLYFPLTGGLFEIKLVKHQEQFYQIAKLYTYTLTIELFQYSSERIDTGQPEIDVFEDLRTFDTTKQTHIDVPDSYGDNEKAKAQWDDVGFSTDNPFGDLT